MTLAFAFLLCCAAIGGLFVILGVIADVTNLNLFGSRHAPARPARNP